MKFLVFSQCFQQGVNILKAARTKTVSQQQSPPDRLPPSFYVSFAGVILLLCAHALYYNYATDDAFITFRYVRNMLDGHGLVYNPGERVEGYTNFLWAMLLALPAWLGVRLEWAAKALGLFFGAATIAIITAIARTWMGHRLAGRQRIALLLPGALLAASGPFAMWTLGGLETVFFTFLLALATFLCLSSNRPRSMLLVGLLFALLVMTRPDGVLFLAATLTHLALGLGEDGITSKKKRILNGLLLLAAFSAVYVPYFIWRYTYYGYLLPNTFYAKVGGGTDSFIRGLRYVWMFFSTYGFVPVAAASVFFYVRMQQPARHKESSDGRFASYLFLQLAFYLLFIIFVGGDQLVMKRFFAPLLPAIYLLSFRGFSEFFSEMSAERSKRWTFGLAAGVATALIIVLLPSFAGRERNRVFKAEKPADSDRKLLGEWLKQNLNQETTIALIPAGITPYYSGLRTIDLVGLNDVRIAHTEAPDFGKGEPGHEKHNSPYVLERRPDLIFLGACRIWPQKMTPDMLRNYYWIYGQLAPGVREMLQLAELKENYSAHAARIGSGYVHFFKRNDFPFPLAEPLAASASG